jgi:hypothetical protein
MSVAVLTVSERAVYIHHGDQRQHKEDPSALVSSGRSKLLKQCYIRSLGRPRSKDVHRSHSLGTACSAITRAGFGINGH